MAGHSKWHNIKRKKASEDAKKGKIFSKISRQIIVAAKEGGGDPDTNSSLRVAIDKAKEVNMPKENIERAIERGAKGIGGEDYKPQIYEGFGAGGEAFYIKALTDNKNRTVSEIRRIFDTHGGSLGGAGSTAYIFSPESFEPSYKIEIADNSQKQELKELFEELEGHDDVQEVYINFDL